MSSGTAGAGAGSGEDTLHVAEMRAPVLLPPWKRQRPFRMAGWAQQPPTRVFAPQRGAVM
jgi:hypothetical protein